MNRQSFLGHLGASVAAANMPWLAACGTTQSLVIATNPWIGYETLYLARDFKWLPERVELRDFKTASNSLTAMQDKQADAACLTLDEMLLGRAMGLPLSATNRPSRRLSSSGRIRLPISLIA